MRFIIRHDFTKYQPRWTASYIAVFGGRNEGCIIEANSERDAIEAFNATRLPGARLNPFYLTITAAP